LDHLPDSVLGSAFVTKLNAQGDALLYSTYLGRDHFGEGDSLTYNGYTYGHYVYHEYFQNGHAITADDQGLIYVTGDTQGYQHVNPLAGPPNHNAVPVGNGGGQGNPRPPLPEDFFHCNDVVVARINPVANGGAVVHWNIANNENNGRDRWESGQGIALGPNRTVYVTGWTRSSDYVITPGAFQTSLNGNQDAFMTTLDNGLSVLYSTYLGGSASVQFCFGGEAGNAIAVDDQGNGYVTGYTDSTDFPATPGAYQQSGQYAAFVTKLNPGGSGRADLIASTYLEGSGDAGYGISLQVAGGLYYPLVAGGTGPNFRTTPNATQAYFGGNTDAFLTKLDADFSQPLFSTFWGGPDYDGAYAITGYQDASSYHAYITGYTGSSPDVFVTKYSQL
jgi:hypothetical protein